jgi:ABC-type multidrug transport system fused ATPase/permease subunit
LLGLLLFAGIGLQLANPQIAKQFIDQAQAGESFERLVGIALLFLGVALLTQIATVAETYVAEDLGWRTTNALRADLTRHVLDLDDSFHVEHSSGELIERIDGDVSAIADFFARFVVQVIGSGTFLLGVLVLLFFEDWRVGLLMTAFVLVAVVYLMRGGGFVASRSRLARQSSADLSAYLGERLDGVVDLKTSGADDDAMRLLHKRLGARFRNVSSSVMAASIFHAVAGGLLVIGMGAALALSAYLLGVGAMTLGSVYVVFRYTDMLRQPAERLARQLNGFMQASGASVRVAELLGRSTRVTEGTRTMIAEGAVSVQFDEVVFAYETEPVLRGVSFFVPAGDVLGIVGRTGSGKTTVSRLLFRLHDPLSGAVRLNGVDLSEIRTESLRQRVGLVTQDVQLFQGTLRDNVTLFDASVADARLGEVFAQLDLDEWLESLPDGLGTQLGAGARGLSAGEGQLVALARVFLKDPALVVLDEASSRLDPHTEQMLERAITRLLAGRSGVVIAHRLAALERADWILVLEDGQVAEFGRRAELAALPGSRFARLQAAGMTEALV